MAITAASVWSKCLEFIKDNISDQAFATWFEPIKAIKLDEPILTIQVPSKFFYEWLEEHYIKLLKVSLQKELGPDAKLVYSIVMDQNLSKADPYTVKIPSSNKEKLKPQELNAPMNIESSKVKNPFVIPGLQKLKIDSQLNINFNFDNFIEGETNRLARSAGKAIAKRPGGTSFNPLFIYGGVGLGKTHLAHAIGLEVKEKHPEKTVLYVDMQKFIQQYAEASRSNNRNDFIHFYQMIDVLIIDDVQFLSGKKGTQDVFFHIFNDLHQRGHQLVLTSDKPPVDIQDMEQRLISRFKWGLSADLQIPEYDLRRSILVHKLEKDGLDIPEEVVDYIAKNVKSNIRELEGALNSLMAQSLLNKKEITLPLAQKALANLVKHHRKEISIDYIQKVVCEYFKIPLEKVQSKTRKRDIVQARQLAMFFAKQYTNASLASIGSQIGKRDHATVLHACKTVKNLSETDKIFKGYVEDLRRKIGAE
ncbi:chromosomal replication initiator protein DnaA [Flavobacteriaceae bacterium Ap0902]|nr:chromosomal replication initiator protein DnaA [Flavobacteriaceae bacterium Ap0902]